MKRKAFIFFLFLIIIIILVVGLFSMKKEGKTSKKIEPNKMLVIDKIIYYSSANAISNTTNYQSPEWNLKVYQYTDIAIYVNRINALNEEEFPEYITGVYLEDFETDLKNSKLYYLNPNDFGNGIINLDSIIEDKLEYTVVNSENNDNVQNYNIPIFFQDCSNPITLRLVTELANQYQVPNDHTLIYNGNLIKELGLGMNELNKRVKFDLIVVSKDSKHIKTISLEIPYEEGEKSIFDGDVKIEKIENIVF